MAIEQHLRLGDWVDLGEGATRVRFEVFVKEQWVPIEEEIDALDPKSMHALIEINGQPVATGRLCPDGRIGRMAVLKKFRGQGLGGEILQALISKAAAHGQNDLYLHAQTQAVGFYERYGFVAEGPEFEETGIAHRVMRWKN